MRQKVGEIVRKYREIEQRLCDPEVAGDVEQVTRLMKERARLQPIAQEGERYLAACEERDEAEALLTGDDSELRALAKEEYERARALCAEREQKLKILLLPKSPNDERNVVMEIRGGTGGEESALFAAQLYRMYTMYALSHGFQVEVISQNETELGGFKEICFLVGGQGAYSRFKYESGTHRVQRVPQTESGGRIHTSAVTVAVLPEAEEVEVHIDPADLQIDTYRSSGAGGQHINKTESAIRITHLPTGLVVECQDERSQYKNKDKAMRVLRARLLEREQRQKNAEIAEDRREQVGSGDRSERVRTYNFPQGRVTDHRINLTLYKLPAILDGDLDELIDALATADQAERLKSGEETGR